MSALGLSCVVAAGGFLDVLGTIGGVLLGLAGLAVAFMGLIAMTEGAVKRGGSGLVVGLALAAVGCWLVGAIP